MNSLQYALDLIDRSFGRGINQARNQTRGLDNAVNGVNSNLRKTKVTGRDAFQSITRYAKGAAAAVGLALGIGAVVSFGQEVTKTTAKFEGFTNAIEFASGNQATQNLGFVEQQIKDLSLPMESAYKGFQMLSGSLKGTALEGQATRDIFESVGIASTVMNLSAEQSEGAFLALSQMASKGKVQAEELRGQLGERIPGALGIAARAMGVTQAELNKMLDEGKVYAEDFLPKFAKELKTTFQDGVPKAVNSMQASINRYENSLINFKLKTGETFRPLLTGAMEMGTKLFGFFGELMSHTEPVRQALKAVGDAFQPIKDAMANNPFLDFAEGGSLAQSVMEGIADVIQFLMPVFELLGNIIGAIEQALNTVRTALMDNINSMTESGNVAQFLTNVMDGLKWVWELIAPAIGYVGDILGAVIGVVFQAVDAILGVINSIIEWGKKTEWIQRLLNAFVGIVQNVFKSIRDTAMNILGGVGDLLVGIFTLDMDKIKSGLSKGFDAVKSAVGVNKSIIDGAIDGWNKDLEKPVEKDLKVIAKAGGTDNNAPSNLLSGNTDNNTTPANTPAGAGNNSGKSVAGGGTVNESKKTTFNIESFVKNLTIQTTNLKESPAEIKRLLESIFNEALADIEIRANA